MRSVILASLIVAMPLSVTAQSGDVTPWVALDARRTLPGEQADYLEFIRANWAPARAEAKRQGHVLDYSVQVAPKDSLAPGGWDVLLVTVYRDSAAVANAEEIFRPILASRQLVRINGKNPASMSVGLWYQPMRLVYRP